MHARVASGVFLALGFADLAVLNLVLAPRLAAEWARGAVELPRASAATPATSTTTAAPTITAEPRPTKAQAIAAAPRPAAELAPTSAAPDVLFELSSHRIRSREASLALQRVAHELRADGSRSVLLRGHSDRLGTSAHNAALSRQRAESVRHFLIAFGAPGDRIAIEAVGHAEPADPGDNPTAWAKNRRVQILWR